MTAISKADLARELGVTKARVSQYIRDGMPVCADGKLDHEEVLKHLRMNRVSAAGSARGPVRATKLLQSGPQNFVKPQAEVQPDWIVKRWSKTDHARIEALYQLIRRCRPALAHMAIEAGAKIEVAYAIADLGQMELLGVADTFLGEEGVPGWAWHEIAALRLDDRGQEPDWRRIAKATAQKFDRAACEKVLAALPIQHDRPLLDPCDAG